MKSKDPLPWYPRERPWLPPWYDESVVYAARAVAEGIANKGQQQLFWRYCMFISGAENEFADIGFQPDELGGERDTNFALGKRFVGLMLRKLLRPELTPKPKDDNPKSNFRKGE